MNTNVERVDHIAKNLLICISSFYVCCGFEASQLLFLFNAWGQNILYPDVPSQQANPAVILSPIVYCYQGLQKILSDIEWILQTQKSWFNVYTAGVSEDMLSQIK
jgi:hypothetical protein